MPSVAPANLQWTACLCSIRVGDIVYLCSKGWQPPSECAIERTIFCAAGMARKLITVRDGPCTYKHNMWGCLEV